MLKLVLKDVLLYPNSVSVPLMTNFGVPPEPQGMVKVTLTKIDNLKTTDLLTKGDPYVVFEVRLATAHTCVKASIVAEWIVRG
jgi:Ca2+-dependent lipid-binding protein